MDDTTLDLCGVACPATWIAASLRLCAMRAGEQLVVLLDEGKPAAEFARSAKAEGHKVLALTRHQGKVAFTVACQGLRTPR